MQQKIAENGEVFSWGYNRYGSLGLGDNTNRNKPEQVCGSLKGKKIIQISCESCNGHCVALTGMSFSFFYFYLFFLNK